MTLSMKVEVSHRYSFNSDIKMAFKVLLVPEKITTATGFHYIVLLDTSGSMDGLKIENAKRGAIELLKRIPQGNKVSFVTFSSRVNIVREFADPEDLTTEIADLTAGGQTVLYTALLTAFNLHNKYKLPSYVILLTDGNPTDDTNTETYKRVPIPSGVQAISFGLGDDYNETILKTLADRSGGVFYHVNDAMEIPDKLPKAAKTKIAAKNVNVEFVAESNVKLLNYSGPPVKINAVEGVIKILGEAVIPPNYNGNFMTVKVNYEEPTDGRKQALLSVVNISSAQDQSMFVKGVNKDVLLEYEYFNNLQKVSNEVEAGNLVEATRTLKRMEEIAGQTRKIELMETTRRLSDSLETTKRASNATEQTRKLSKEVSSEVTRKLRGES
ncbi:VWA domain-containing protein [Metallosphaera hakonensis]|uniref:VWA domain-containing protein n=1 Tax=Metallosphaera hakonensis JCM 8857 = DSM 7519 TaxID=1293036 RepID=A0A2U9IVV9_9CREN|nr:VWA domain-containing protein [Metallosphaera hakonensis]AWS00169.1 VWA domain-containing protein [Metallosphaera hakonensis JCM 8857 = DSM 7519]